MEIISSFLKKTIYLFNIQVKINIFRTNNMSKQYIFNQNQMNGIVEEIYPNIIKECEKTKIETNCPNEQIVALLNVIASNITPLLKKQNIV